MAIHYMEVSGISWEDFGVAWQVRPKNLVLAKKRLFIICLSPATSSPNGQSLAVGHYKLAIKRAMKKQTKRGKMRKSIFVASSVVLLQLTGVSSVFAGGVENLHNFSAEYVRTFNRNAATDSADAVVYNPAGTVQMEDGSYINLSLQYLGKDYKNIITGSTNSQNDGTLSQDESSLIPGLFGLHKNGKWSAYAAVTVANGGGEVMYGQGSASIHIANESIAGGVFPISSAKVEAESVGVGLTVGGAYKVSETVAVSLGVKRLSSEKEYKASFTSAVPVTIDYEAEASGWIGIFGLNYRATEALYLAARYEMRTKLDYEHTINSATNATGTALLAAQGITDKMKKRCDLPAILGLGASYQLTPALKVDTTLTYYLQEDADWAGAEDNVDNGYDAGVAFEYSFNERLRGSVGYMYTETGIGPQYTLKESPKLDANSFGTGFVYVFNDKMEMNLGVGISIYDDDSYLDASGLTIGYEKEVIFGAAGFQYKF